MRRISLVSQFPHRRPNVCCSLWQKSGHSFTGLSRILLTLVICLGSISCTGMVLRQIPDSQKDLSRKFDGIWWGEIKGGGIQYTSSQGVRCKKEKRWVQLLVADGKLRAMSGLPTGGVDTNVDSEGKFRLEIPTEGKYPDGSVIGITMVVQGNLDQGVRKGFYVVGQASQRGGGCSYRIGFEPARQPVPVKKFSYSRKNTKYANEYKGLIAGVTSRSVVFSTLGEPKGEKSPTRFSFDGGIDITFNQDEKIRAIIIYNQEYSDRHGLSVGMSVESLKSVADIDIRELTAVDKKNGIIYRFDSQNKIREIVLASEAFGDLFL